MPLKVSFRNHELSIKNGVEVFHPLHSTATLMDHHFTKIAIQVNKDYTSEYFL